jgi:hypothetical protein
VCWRAIFVLPEGQRPHPRRSRWRRVYLQDAPDHDTIGKRIEVVIIPLADSFGRFEYYDPQNPLVTLVCGEALLSECQRLSTLIRTGGLHGERIIGACPLAAFRCWRCAASEASISAAMCKNSSPRLHFDGLGSTMEISV